LIQKEHTLPLKIRKLQALSRRLPGTHPKKGKIDEELFRRMAGYNGEQSLDYYFSFLPRTNHYIFHDLRLPSGNFHFQIDTLILSPYYILIIETKNLAGTLYFDDTFNQLIRTINGKEEAFPCPILQVMRHQKLLTDWLTEHKFPSVPIASNVVISNPQTIIKASNINSHRIKKVIHSANLPLKFEEYEKKFKEVLLTSKDLKKATTLLLKQSSQSSRSILEEFYIKEEDLMKGVHCPSCFNLPMGRKRSSWYCLKCKTTSKDAHVAALMDYSLLINNTITNSKLQNFLQLSSRSTALTILKSMNLKSDGLNKGKIYYLPVPY
jgi:ribosomal protein L37AE/L43A